MIHSAERYLCRILQALSLATLAAQPITASAQDAAPSVMQVTVDRSRVSLAAEDVPLADVLRELGRQGGFEVELRGGFAEPVTDVIVDLEVSAAIAQLLGGGRYSFFLQFAPATKGTKIRRLAKLTVIDPEGEVGFPGVALVGPKAAPPHSAAEEVEVARTKEATELLQGILREEEDPEIRDSIIEALERLADGETGI